MYTYIYIKRSVASSLFNPSLSAPSSCSLRGQTKETESTEIKKTRESLNGPKARGILY